jgi:acetoin utilization deacetylase AcuC-like enzyme
MKTFYTPAHLAHSPAFEFEAGQLTPAVEVPQRAEAVRARIEARGLGPILPPGEFGNEPALRIHDPDFVQFLSHAYDEWCAHYPDNTGDALPSVWPARGLRTRRTGDIESKLGSHTFDTATPITKGSFQAAHAAVNTVLSGAQAIQHGDRHAFALTRPPGHHASRDLFGGYCYLNNVAIAAQWLSDEGLRLAILDVDYHHGNGTQAIFYDRPDVLFVSVHASPEFAFPHFLGFADERGQGAGAEVNLNLPLPKGTDWGGYMPALDAALKTVCDFGPDALLVSLGLDTFENDPICGFRLRTEEYLRMGETIARLGKPTLFVFEGGYNLDHLAENTVNVLEGFLGR